MELVGGIDVSHRAKVRDQVLRFIPLTESGIHFGHCYVEDRYIRR